MSILRRATVSKNSGRFSRMTQRLADLDREALAGGGPERVEKQHAAGKLTARERL
jgi:acetyl-CoA carboxylase carboxyltransferase component